MAIAKYLGRDCELSSTGLTADGRTIHPFDVTKQILRHIDAAFAPLGRETWTRRPRLGGFDGIASAFSADCLRHWAPNGQCYYSDMSHLEVCTASTRFPRRYAAQCLSTLRVAEAARRRALEESAEGDRYSLAPANVDLLDPSISWGTHVNVAITSALFEDLLLEPRHPAILGFVASALAAAIPFFGAGYLLPFKDGSVIYSLSGRAHHLAKIKTYSTTEAFRRGLLNARREPHGDGHDRLHLIGFDFCLAAAALKGSFLQCCFAAAEEGYCGLNLYDPVRALRNWSWNLDPRTGRLTAAAALIDGRKMTLFGYIRELAGNLLRMVESGLIPADVAPEAGELLPRILELAERAERGAVADCAKHLDWAAKLLYLTDLCRQQNVTLESPVARLADHDFANTDPQKGAFWQLWDAGLIDPLVAPSDVQACLRDGPADSRGWARGRLVQQFFDDLTDVDWSYLELRRTPERWGNRLRVEMPRLDSLNQASFAAVLSQADGVEQLEQLLQQDDPGLADQSDPMLDIQSQLAQAPAADEPQQARP